MTAAWLERVQEENRSLTGPQVTAASIARGVAQRRSRRVRQRAGWATGFAALVVSLVIVALPRPEPKSVPLAVHQTELVSPGAEVTALAEVTQVLVVEDTAGLLELELQAGSARFSVDPARQREVRVRAGMAEVRVVGTVFTVTVADEADASVEVGVTRGLVHVSVAEQSWPLAAGQRGRFDSAGARLWAGRSETAATSGTGERRAGLPATAEDRSARKQSPAGAPKEGDESEAERKVAAPGSDSARGRNSTQTRGAALSNDAAQSDDAARDSDAAQDSTRDGPAPSDAAHDATRDEAGALLQQADEARLAGDPAGAIRALRRLLEHYPRDGRAPSAAFTLGVLELASAPARAAASFAQSRRLQPQGPLAEDALAREVEAWSRAGHRALAHERAREYLRLYPQGRRAETVRSLGGLD